MRPSTDSPVVVEMSTVNSESRDCPNAKEKQKSVVKAKSSLNVFIFVNFMTQKYKNIRLNAILLKNI